MTGLRIYRENCEECIRRHLRIMWWSVSHGWRAIYEADGHMNQNGANGRSDRLFSQAKIRQTFVAGIFASVPLAVTAFIIWYVDGKTRNFLNWLLPNWPHVPGLGIVLAIALIYVVGMVTTSFLGKFFLSLIDGILMRLPVI